MPYKVIPWKLGWDVSEDAIRRERIKPFFLQKTCIIPLSGFFASLFWLFII